MQGRQGLGVVGALDGLELDPPGDAVLHGGLEQLVEHGAHLALGHHAREQGDGLALEQTEGRRHAGLPEGLHEQRLERLEQLGRGRQVGAEHEQPALERRRDPHHGLEELAGLRVGRPPQHEHTGHLQRAVEGLVEVLGVDLDDEPAGHGRLTVGRFAGDGAGRHPGSGGRRGGGRHPGDGGQVDGAAGARGRGGARSWSRFCQRGDRCGLSAPGRRRAGRSRR